MDVELLEKIDSFWFFSSVLRPSSQLLTEIDKISTKSNEYTDAEKQQRSVGEQTAAIDARQNEKENSNCIEIAGVEKRRGKRKGRKSKNRVQKWIQQSSAGMQWEERTPFAVLYDRQIRNSRSNERSGIDSKSRRLTTLPMVRDDLAMKEQLRSWAYAVACSVR